MPFNYGDTVRNKVSGIVGIVICCYSLDEEFGAGVIYLDVRVDDRVYYSTLASNWELVLANDDEGTP